MTMSYESSMYVQYNMPTREQVENALLRALFRHGGTLKEFGSGQEIVDEIANDFGLTEEQRSAFLETVYRKENRVKKSLLWHRLLFRAADSLAKEKLVSRPTRTLQINNKREWMLTEKGFDETLKLENIPATKKDYLPTKTFEVQKIVKDMLKISRPNNYNPFDDARKSRKITKESTIRARGFRQAVIEAYDYKCAICKLKIHSPDKLLWEVEAAHIVPHGSHGRDDVWNGLALCHLHHWAFDVGWFTLRDDYTIFTSTKAYSLSPEIGIIDNTYEFIRRMPENNKQIYLPAQSALSPHPSAIQWHRENIFFQ